jgi:hypothetical protein
VRISEPLRIEPPLQHAASMAAPASRRNQPDGRTRGRRGLTA